MYEDEKLYRPAMERYRQASEYYLGEHFVPQSCQCLYKVCPFRSSFPLSFNPCSFIIMFPYIPSRFLL